MSDSETPQPDPDPDPAPAPGAGASAAEPVGQVGHGHGRGRRGVWAAAAAVLCVAVGTLASLLAAHAVAHNDGAKTRAGVQQSSQAIASTLKLAIQRQEELTVAATTFFAANPKASHAEFAAWV
jgi:hypothetical protein